MKNKILKVLRQYADREVCYEIEELAGAICEAIEPSYSKKIAVVPILDQNFKGDTFNEKRDGKRLRTLQQRVEDFMSDKGWHTLEQIKNGVRSGSESSISARLRDAANSGRWRKQRRSTSIRGLFVYRLLPLR